MDMDIQKIFRYGSGVQKSLSVIVKSHSYWRL